MTMKEAYAAGARLQRVEYNGTIYKRILRVGYFFRDNGTYGEYAEIAEYHTGTVVSVPLDKLQVMTEEAVGL